MRFYEFNTEHINDDYDYTGFDNDIFDLGGYIPEHIDDDLLDEEVKTFAAPTKHKPTKNTRGLEEWGVYRNVHHSHWVESGYSKKYKKWVAVAHGVANGVIYNPVGTGNTRRSAGRSLLRALWDDRRARYAASPKIQKGNSANINFNVELARALEDIEINNPPAKPPVPPVNPGNGAPQEKPKKTPVTAMFWAKLIEGPKIVVAGELFELEDGGWDEAELKKDGYKKAYTRSISGGTKMPNLKMSGAELAAIELVDNGRYLVKKESEDSYGNRVFSLTWESTVTDTSDKQRLGMPGITVATARK